MIRDWKRKGRKDWRIGKGVIIDVSERAPIIGVDVHVIRDAT